MIVQDIYFSSLIGIDLFYYPNLMHQTKWHKMTSQMRLFNGLHLYMPTLMPGWTMNVERRGAQQQYF